ncbi:carbon starvation protein A, partial [bacterium]|nr:carbon starvation protein A [bacterium]
YLTKNNKFYGISLLPALFMTAVTVSYILMAPEGFNLSQTVSISSGISISILSYGLFYFKTLKK